MKSKTKRNWYVLLVWIILMSGSYLTGSVIEISDFILSALACYIFSWVFVLMSEDIYTTIKQKANLSEFIGDAIYWKSREIEEFKSSYDGSLRLVEDESERRKLRLEFEIAIGELKNANSRFTKSLILAVIATLVVFFFDDRQKGFATAIMLLFCPYLIAKASVAEEKSSSESLPMSLIKNKSVSRNCFANSVWAIFISIIVSLAILNWGSSEESGGPFN